MMGLLISALAVMFVFSLFGVTYNLDYVHNAVYGFHKEVPSKAVSAVLVNGKEIYGFDRATFIDVTQDYFDVVLGEKYGADSFKLGYEFYQHDEYPGIASLPTGAKVSIITEAVPLISYSEELNVYIRRGNKVGTY